MGQPADWLSLVIFLLSGTMIAWVAESLLRAHARASQAETEALLAAEREAATEALRASEAKYRDLFENMTEEVHFWKLVRDENGQIKTWKLVDANPPTLKTWGKTLEEIQGRTTDEVFGPGATEHYLPIVQKIMTEGVPFAFEDYFPNLDKYFRFTSVPLGDYFITTGTDITTMKKAAEALRTSEQRHRLLAETMLQGVVHQDAEGKIIAMNPAAERILGKTREQFLGSSSTGAEDHTIREDGSPFPGLEHPSMVALRTGQSLHGVVMGVFNPKVGDYRWISIDAVPVCCQGETQPAEVYTVFEDITERKRAVEALRDSEQRLSLALRSASMGVWRLDLRERKRYFDDQVCRCLGIDPDGFRGTADEFYAAVHPEDRQALRDALTRAIENGEPYEVVYRAIWPDGRLRHIAARGQLARDRAGQARWLDGLVWDISEHKQAEQRIAPRLPRRRCC